ncbi:MAG: RNA polymerase sigma factor [Fimbriimonadaceae bacterium]
MRSSDQNERRLIERALKGDNEAFNQLIGLHQERVFKYAYRLTRNESEAEDIVGEAFVRVFRALPQFKGKSSFQTWLYTIVTNCYYDLEKKKRARKQISLEQPGRDDPTETSEIQFPDQEPGPDEEYEQNVLRQTLHRAIQKLPEHQKVMIMLYHVEEISYEEISSVMQMPIGTVKSRLNRARLALRQILEEQGGLGD